MTEQMLASADSSSESRSVPATGEPIVLAQADTSSTATPVLPPAGNVVVVEPPAPGDERIVEAEPGLRIELIDQIYDPATATYVVRGEDLVVTLPEESQVILDGFFAPSDSPAVLSVLGGREVAGTELLEFAYVVPDEGPVLTGSGGDFGPYDPGNIGPGLDPLGPLGPTSLSFGVPEPEHRTFLDLAGALGDDGSQPNPPGLPSPLANDDRDSSLKNVAVDVDVLHNDVDNFGDGLLISNIVGFTYSPPLTASAQRGAPESGASAEVVIIDGEQQIQFTPPPGFSGEVTFDYEITDANGRTSVAQVTVDLSNRPPVAEDDAADTFKNQAVDVDLLINDSDPDGDPITIVEISDSPHGRVELAPDGRTLIFTPDEGFSGQASVHYRITDGDGGFAEADAIIDVINRAPDAVDDPATTDKGVPITIEVLDNDSDPDGDPIRIVEVEQPPDGGTVTIAEDGLTLIFTPDGDVVGDVDFDYTITDRDDEFDTATVTVAVTNEAPTISVSPGFDGVVAELSLGFEPTSAQPFPPLTEFESLDPALINGVDIGNMTLEQTRSITITFIGEGAVFRNSLGIYSIGADGTFERVEFIWDDASSAIFNPDYPNENDGTGDLIDGISNVQIPDLPAGTRVGFFIIADGASVNGDDLFGSGSLTFVNADTGLPANVNDGQPPALRYLDGNGAPQTASGLIYHTASSSGDPLVNDLNPDGAGHAVSGLAADSGSLVIGFEDIEISVDDDDYNDLVIAAEWGTAPQDLLFSVPPEGGVNVDISDADDSELSGAEVVISAGLLPGDTLVIAGDDDGDGTIDGTSIRIIQDGSNGILVLEGLDDIAAYETVLSTINLGNDNDDPQPGLREISFTVTDPTGDSAVPSTIPVNIRPPIVGTEDDDVLFGDEFGGVTDALSGRGGDDELYGGDARDILDGGAGDDELDGGEDDDILLGSTGADTLTGGAGADVFGFLTLSDRIDTITDLDADEGDRIDLSVLFSGSGFDPSAPNADEFVRFDESGSEVTLSVDLDGTANNFTFFALAILENPQGLTGNPEDVIVA